MSLATLGETSIPTLTTKELNEAFNRVRDHRFLHTSDSPDFPRRASWLYPDDGCYSRAALASHQFDTLQLQRPSKVFIFGNLSAQTPNSPEGAVYWWFHVAPIVSVAVPSDRTGLSSSHPENWYVIDPTLEPKHPMRFMDWVTRQTDDPSSVRIAVCDTHTYRPEHPCDQASDTSEADAESDEMHFLSEEWSRQIELGRDPHQVLGTQPPWLSRS